MYNIVPQQLNLVELGFRFTKIINPEYSFKLTKMSPFELTLG